MLLLIVVLLLSTSPIIYGQYQDGDIRLVGGSYQWEGRVEIYFSGMWGTIADSDWTDEDAEVVCRNLGYIMPGAIAKSNGYFGKGDELLIHLDIVQCSGLERNLVECWSNCCKNNTNHSLDVGVKCQPFPGSYKEGDVHLVGGPYNWVGCVEIFWSESWGAISDTSWTDEDANVICRQLQHSTGTGIQLGSAVGCLYDDGNGSGMMAHFNDVMCSGAENIITDCTLQNTQNVTSQLVGVECQQGDDDDKNGQIRLVGSGVSWVGRVELFLSGEWGTMSDDASSHDNAIVICRQLGYALYGVTYYNEARFGEGYGIIHIDILRCSGLEFRINDCDYDANTQEESHSEDWSVSCTAGECVTGDVRLVGETEAEGKVEICIYGWWSTVCGKYWTNNNTAVLCRHLGFSDIISDLIYYSFEGDADALSVSFNCTGTEQRLWEKCSYSNKCTHAEDIGVHCPLALCSDGQLNLLEYGSGFYKRVVICSNRRWETFSYNHWSNHNSIVACNELGFEGVGVISRAYSLSRFGGPRHSKYYSCKGSEPTLSDCNNNTETANETLNGDVLLICVLSNCADGDVRLSKEVKWEGRLEICSNGRWGRVHGDQWTPQNTKVVCTYLGYESGTDIPTNPSILQALSKPLYMHSVICSGTELSLLHCVYNTSGLEKIANNNAEISCQQPSCSDGDLKLVGGESESDGRLEMCLHQRWTTINKDGWTNIDSTVACKQLNYSTSESVSFSEIQRGSLDAVQTSNYRCNGHEIKLRDCQHNEEYEAKMFDIKVISIRCGSSEPMTPMTTNDDGHNTAVIVSLTIAALCFSALVVFVMVYIIRRRRDKSSGRETVVIGDNVSYIISSTGRIHSVEDTYYSSISLAPKEEFISSRKQPLPPIPLVALGTKQDTINPGCEIQDTRGDSEIQDNIQNKCSTNNKDTNVKDIKIQDTDTRDADKEGSKIQGAHIQGREMQGTDTTKGRKTNIIQGREIQGTDSQEIKDIEMEHDHIYDSCK